MKTRSGSDASFTSSAYSFCDRQTSAAREHAPRGAVDDELAEVEQLAPRRAAPQQRVDARDELLVDERPREVVVAARERAHLRLRVGAAEHDDRAVVDAAAVERIGIAEHETSGRPSAAAPRCSEREHVEAVAAGAAARGSRASLLRFCEQQCRHDAEHMRAAATARQMSFFAEV